MNEADGGGGSSRSVRILSAAGEAVTGAEAVVISGLYQVLEGTAEAPLRADGEGRIALSLPPEQLEDALLLVWAPGHGSLRFQIDAGAGTQEARLPALTPLRGRIEARGGRVEHAWLDTTDHEAPWPHFVRCHVDDDGRFMVLGLAAGTYRVSSRPLGGAPVLSADQEGNVRFLAEDPGPVPALNHRFLDREITADGQEHTLRVAFGRAMVFGEVVDESGAPIAGAQVELSSEQPGRVTAQTNALGRFEAAVPPSPNVRIAASHPDHGHQWTDNGWRGWSQYDEIPDTPVRLVLRRGVVLRGQLVDEQGRPRPNLDLLLIPAYRGSGPATLEAQTDSEGRFAFERAVLNHFELVPRSLDEWHPDHHGRPGEHLRIIDDHEQWLASSAADEPIELRLESYTLVAVVVRLTNGAGAPLRNQPVDVWTRSAPDRYLSQAPRTDGEGRVRVLMERGVNYELWALVLEPEQNREAPWTNGIDAQWTGTPNGPTQLTIVAPEPNPES